MFARSILVSSLISGVAASSPSVQEAWDHHTKAFSSGDLEALLEDYREDSVVEHYDYSNKNKQLRTATGLDEIRSLMGEVLSTSDKMMLRVSKVTEEPAKQTYLAWTNALPSGTTIGTDTFLFSPDNSIYRQQFVTASGLAPASYDQVNEVTLPAAKSPVPIDPSYSKDSVQAAWENHFGAVGAQDVQKLMQDYTEASELVSFDHRTGVLVKAKGLAQIQGFFEHLFGDMTALPDAPVLHITDDDQGKQVFLVWSCPSCGFLDGTDSFIFDENNKIAQQNTAYRSVASPTMV